ncbi:BNR/Asp-box repeat protein [Beggiatoa alba B18LD]|uniref:BNR/Asp-box repeat protein n=1 Tax=Beggiatoa alba B18LD TaxID=395493 RepID=I3CBS0_9GAMM|nr:hypothetical protein [Beggiatoa alba]EIJ41063.1 BNR/Asp-box repeat protein [Beggiatoa alba B18LD]
MKFYTLILWGGLLSSMQSFAGENNWTIGHQPDGGSAYRLWVDTQTTPYTLFSEMGNNTTLYYSTDKSENWVLSQAPLVPKESYEYPYSVPVKDPHADIWYALQAKTGVFYKREGIQGEWVAVTADAGFELPIQEGGYYPPEQRIQIRLIAPTTPSSIYVNLAEGSIAGKIYRSQDGGKRWEEMFNTWQDNGNERLSFSPDLFADPNNPATIYTTAYQTTGQGDATITVARLYQSTDGGKHWTATNHPASPTFKVATVIPTQPATLYSLTLMPNTETWTLNRSTLTGDNLTTLNLFPTSSDDFYTRKIQLVANAQQPQTLYAIQTANYKNFPSYYRSLRYPPIQDAGLEFNRIYKSIDGGNTWTLLQAGLPYSTMSYNRIHDAVIDPNNADILYLASSYGILKTTDGGNHWQLKNQGIHETRNIEAVFSPNSVAAIDTPSVYIYSNGEFFQSTDRGETWQTLTSLSLSTTNLAVNSYQTPFKFYGYTNDCQSLSIQVQGETEIRHPLPTTLQTCPNLIHHLLTVPYDNKVLYLITNFINGKASVFKTTDDGATWSALFEETNTSSTFIVDPITPQVLYKIAGALYRSTDDGKTWQVIGSMDLLGSLVQIGIATDTHTLYAQSYKGIFKSTDQGATWTMINHGLQAKIESYNNDENISFTGSELTLSASNTVYARSYNTIARYYPEKNVWCPVAPLTSIYNWRIDAYDENTLYGRDFLKDGIASYTRNNPEPELFSGTLGAYTVNTAFPTDAIFKGGIQLPNLCTETAKGFYLPLTSPVNIRGTIQPETKHLGQTADIVVYAAFKHPLLPNQTLYFMLGEDNSIQVWDGKDVTALVPFKHNVTLAEQNEVIMYQGQFVATGQLFIRFGYRLADGTLIVNQESLVVDID